MKYGHINIFNMFLHTFNLLIKRQISIYYENIESVFLSNHYGVVLYSNKNISHTRKLKIQKYLEIDVKFKVKYYRA